MRILKVHKVCEPVIAVNLLTLCLYVSVLAIMSILSVTM